MNLKSFLAAGLALAALCALPADAATRAAQSFPVGVVDATAGSTFATTSFADLAGATLSLTPQVDPNRAEAPGTPIQADTILVEFNADVIKATATTGTCGVFVNGAIVTKFNRSIDFAAKQGTMTIVAPIPNTTTGAQTVKIQCKSGDTNVFTVNNGVLRVVEIL
jgi:hypothetical protein